MVIVDSEMPSGFVGPVPVMVEFAATGVPAEKTTVPPALETGAVMERVLVSAFREARVQVATPAVSVDEQAP